MFRSSYFFNILFILIILCPNIFSVFFAALHLGIPSYLFAIIISIIIVSIIFINHLAKTKIYIINKITSKILMIIFFGFVFLSILYSESTGASKEKIMIIVYNTITPIFLFESFFLFSKKKKLI